MDKHQARFILQSCRPEGRDADDPRFAEAWQVVEGDAELGSRLTRERALDSLLASRLRSIEVPATLPSELLAGIETRLAARRQRQTLRLALAASVLLLLSLAGAWIAHVRSATQFAQYRQEMLGHLNGRLQLSFTSESPAALQEWLESKRGVCGAVIPAGLESLPGIGCRTWTWNGRPAGLICFLVHGREAVHLLIVSRDAVSRAPHGTAPEFEQVGDWQTASWTRGGNVYLLAGHLDRVELEKFL